jgi:hypothetical protein
VSRRVLAVVAVALGLLVIGYAVFAKPSDEELIRAKLDRLAEVVSFSDGAGNPVFRAARLDGEFADLFTEDVRISIPELSSVAQGRRPLAGLAARGSSYAQSLDVDFQDVDVQLIGGSSAAQVKAVASLTAQRGGRLQQDRRRVGFGFTKRDGDWLIDAVSAQTKLDAPP